MRNKNIIIFLALIIAALFAIVILFKNNSLNLNPSNNNYSGPFSKEFNSLESNSQVVKNPNYERIKKLVITIENTSLSSDEKYKNLVDAHQRLYRLYADTNDNTLYQLNTELSNFAKSNYSKNYKSEDFYLDCLDPKCSDSPQPEEILTIIDQVKSSNLPKEIRDNDIELLTNYSYTRKDQSEGRFSNYKFWAENIKKDPDYIKAGLNEKLYNEMIDYLSKNYPLLIR